MDSLSTVFPFIQGVHQEVVFLEEPLEVIASRVAPDPGTVVLLSGTDMDCARYHILATRPWMTIKGNRQGIDVYFDGSPELHLQGDPLALISTIMDRFSLEAGDNCGPVISGLFGYFAYDVKDVIETLPRTCLGTGLPDIYLSAPSIILVVDRLDKTARLCIPKIATDSKPASVSVSEARRAFFNLLTRDTGTDPGTNPFMISDNGFQSNFTRADYLDAVEKIIDYIRAGDIYQVNLSQRFEAGFTGDPYGVFVRLFQKNPAPFFSFVNAGDHQIISTSPERFVQRRGRFVETRPIKGTIARGKTGEEDASLGRELLRSGKDDAELSMIVDLMRNDLGRVATGGSVRVKEHKRLEPYDNVFHLVSIVEAELVPGTSSMELLRATFPGGSITGCPKIRAMEIIDELEPVKRHVYTGSIGYLSFHDTLDLSIAIRTATVHNGTIAFSVGGGIVYDSDPASEYQETLHKGKTLLEIFSGGAPRKKPDNPVAWVNGTLLPARRAVVPATGSMLQYGAGIFETVRVEDGAPVRLEAHVNRFNKSWSELFFQEPPDITWSHVIDQLISANRLEGKTAAVKIMGGPGGSIESRTSLPVLAAFVRPYRHRLELSGKSGFDLVTYPFSRHILTADFKTLNYLFYYLASGYARNNNADEALIVNPDGSVSETATCALMIVQENRLLIPDSAHALPSVTQAAAVAALSGQGWEIVRARVMPEDLPVLGRLVLTNALMGAVPVLTLDGRPMEDASDAARMINDLL